MRKILSLFVRNHDGDHLVRDEVTPGCEWVVAGEGVPTIKWDGTACLVKDGKLYKRYDRKKDKRTGQPKDAPPGWEPCQDAPDEHTGHWPGWVPVGEGPEDKWHREALGMPLPIIDSTINGTYELIGPKLQGNPYNRLWHFLAEHGRIQPPPGDAPPKDFDGLRAWLAGHPYEGVVWHHPDGRMCKLKRTDFGLAWPEKGGME